MAFTGLGALGTAVNLKAAGTTLVFTTSADANIGNIIIAHVAFNNIATEDGDSSNCSITDSAGNTYQRLKEYTNTVGGAQFDGASIGLYMTVVTAALAIGGTLTATFSEALIAKSMGAGLFSKDAISVISLVTAQGVTDDAADPQSMTISGLPSREYLFLHGLGHEGLTSDSFTPSTSYTTMGGSGTSGGGADTNIANRSEYRILTGTGDSVDAAWAGSRDGAQVYVALMESPMPSAWLPSPGQPALVAPQREVYNYGVIGVNKSNV